jgi:hypothetical protein
VGLPSLALLLSPTGSPHFRFHRPRARLLSLSALEARSLTFGFPSLTSPVPLRALSSGQGEAAVPFKRRFACLGPLALLALPRDGGGRDVREEGEFREACFGSVCAVICSYFASSYLILLVLRRQKGREGASAELSQAEEQSEGTWWYTSCCVSPAAEQQ